jgi:hypothetical protein
MMRRMIALALVATFVLAVPAALSAAPPPRPLAITSTQFEELQRLQNDSEHVSVADIHASYKTEHELQIERTRLADDISTSVMLIGYPTLIIVLLIAAAPL